MSIEFIELALREVQRAITEATPAAFTALKLTPFTAVERVFAGMAKNPPQCWVMALKTRLAEEETLVDQTQSLTVRLAVTAGDPEAVGAAMIAYVRVVDEAIRNWTWDARILRVFIAEHDYGQLYEHKTGFVRFPDLSVMVRQVEVWQ